MDKPAILGGPKIISEKIRTSCPAIPKDLCEIEHELREILNCCILSNFGKYAKSLEEKFQNILKAKHVLTVPNATTGLQIILSSLPLHSEVIVPSFTFPASVHAIVHANLKPKFADINGNTFDICVKDVLTKINRHTSAILAVNVFGNPCQIDELQSIAEAHRLKLFFDSAAALGSKYRNCLLSSYGHASVFSMSGTKIVSAGEGGIIVTNDDELADQFKCMRNYGYCESKSDCHFIGYNGKLSEFSAVLALYSLKQMESTIAKRHHIAGIYKEQLENIPGLKFQRILDECETNYCTLAVQIDSEEFGLQADTVRDCLEEENIQSIRYFFPLVHRTKAYKRFNGIRLENSERLAHRVLCLPIHPRLTVEHANLICAAIARIHLYAEEIRQMDLGKTRKKINTASQRNEPEYEFLSDFKPRQLEPCLA
ncbi:DegT/DnrJ/EryC1/StrS family aminotransferase [bacterium]|nr:DegT/DnrJ/EryC1/StrS family aminotransferase [bacterium]